MTNFNTTNTYEFALFRLKSTDLKKYYNNYADFKRYINTFEGMISLKTYQSLSDELMILDLGIWDNFENAKKADERVQNEVDAKMFMSPLEQVLHFDNTSFVKEFSNKDLNHNHYMELNIYEVLPNKIEEAKKCREEFYDLVANEIPFLNKVVNFESHFNNNMFVDLLYWDDIDKANESHKKYNEHKKFINYKNTIKELKHFIQMKPLKINNKITLAEPYLGFFFF